MKEALSNFSYQLLDIINSPLVGYLIGFLASVYLVYWQFKRSTAGFRLTNVVKATREITLKLEDSNDNYTGTLQNKYRFSFGVVIDWCSTTFGTQRISKVPGHFPPLVDINTDRWEKFKLYVRPVVEDLNPYSFLGWLPFSRRMKQLRALVLLCNAIEAVVMELDAVVQIDKNKGTSIVKAEDPGFTINVIGHEIYKTEIDHLTAKYTKLELAWNKWLNVALN